MIKIGNLKFDYERNLSYVGYEDSKRTIEVLKPIANRKLPLIFWICCGGFRISDRPKSVINSIKHKFALNGFIAADITVTVVEDYKQRYESFPQNIYDVVRGLSYLKSNSDRFNIDLERVYIAGSSAGACLAVIASWNPRQILEINDELPAIKGTLSICGAANRNYGKPESRPPNQEIYNLGSPELRASPDCPPIFIAHGTEDETVPFSQALQYVSICKKFNIKHKLHSIKGKGHSLDWEHWGEQALEFLSAID